LTIVINKENFNTELELLPEISKPMSLVPFISYLDKLIADQDFDTLEYIISKADPHKISTAATLLLLRTTSMFRSKISSWKPLLIASYPVIDSRGKDSARILKGLDR
jgi:hypothetical protein